jgi:zinc transporter 1/2/3
VSLITYKLLTAALIAVITLLVGFASLRFVRHQKHLLQVGDALADGVFLGVALFHLLPGALATFSQFWSRTLSYPITLAALLAGFALLFILERSIIHREHLHTKIVQSACTASAWMLTGILSVHAFIEGAALGISDQNNTVLILLIAIVAHKGFETYALVMGLHRNLPKEKTAKRVLMAFAFVTPVGILIASMAEQFLQTHTADLMTGFFSAFAAGSFLYIGTLHSSHTHFHPARDRSDRYLKIVATLLGILVMAIVAIWV